MWEVTIPNANITFGGQTLALPGAYYLDLLSGFAASTPTTPPLIYIGYANGMKPQVPISFLSAANLLNAIRGGAASGYVPAIANPSPALFGGQLITFINVGENTQSSLALSNAVGSGVAILTSTNYGVPSNLLQASVTAGSLAGKQLTLYDGYNGSTVVGDNLGVPFQLAYTGAASAGLSFSVTTSGLNATQFAVASPNANESFSIPLGAGQYDTTQKIVQYLNGTGFWSAVGVGDTSLPSAYLDSGQTSVSLAASGSGGYVYSNVTAALGAVLYWTNQYAQQANFATAAASGSVVSYTSGLAPANIPFKSFTGATSVPPINSDYATALNTALTIPGWSVFVDSNASAVRLLASQHVETASSPLYGKWRRYYTGSSPGDSVANAQAAAQGLNSKRTIYAYPGLYVVDPLTGLTSLKGGIYAAAAAAGISVGNPPATPLTNKQLNGLGVELALTVSQINSLQQAGVMPIIGTTPALSGQPNFNQLPPTIASDITTWQVDSNPENMFEQQIKCRDFLAYSLVAAAQPYVGTVAEINNETNILKAIKLTLNALIYSTGSNGVLASWDKKSLVIQYNGSTQTASVSANVVLVGQNRFITEQITIFPLNLSISASTPVPAG